MDSFDNTLQTFFSSMFNRNHKKLKDVINSLWHSYGKSHIVDNVHKVWYCSNYEHIKIKFWKGFVESNELDSQLSETYKVL